MLVKKTVLIGVVAVFSLLFPVETLRAQSDAPEVSRKLGPLLLKKIYESEERKVAGTFSGQAEREASETPSELVKVIAVMDADHLKPLPSELLRELEERVEALGGGTGDHSFNNVQAWLTLDAVEELARWESVGNIRLPMKPRPMSVVSEGVSIVGADKWHYGGLTGQGVKAGVVDIGFAGYSTLLGTELPASVNTKVMGGESEFLSTYHGTACAEILHDAAPGAELFLANAGDVEVDFANALAWFRSQGVSVISSSMGLNLSVRLIFLHEILNAPYSFQADYYAEQMELFFQIVEQFDKAVSDAVSGGAVWSQAAGNDGLKKWDGMFVDSDGDGFLNFSSSENWNEIDASGAYFGDEMYIALVWGDGADNRSADDYDLYVETEFGQVACASVIDQKRYGVGAESCRVDVNPLIKYRVYVKKYDAADREVSLYLGYENFPDFKYNTPAGTVALSPPGSNPGVVSVGAVPYYDTSSIKPFSSQGPGEDGAIKPDLAAPDSVSTFSYGSKNFAGTSAAAPLVAGAAVLVKQRNPSWTPPQVKAYLEANALDLGAPGKDNVFGSGLVNLPAPKGDEIRDVFEDFAVGAGGFSENAYFDVSGGELLFSGDRTDRERMGLWNDGNDSGAMSPVPGDGDYFEDCLVSVDARWRGGSNFAGFGLIANASFLSERDFDGIAFYIDRLGYYSIAGIKGGIASAMVERTFSSAVRTTGAPNTLAVHKRGSDFSFSINGATVEKLIVEHWTGGAAGVVANGQGDAGFDNFAVVRLPDLTGARPVSGDWNGDGFWEIGLYARNVFYLDFDNDGFFDARIPYGKSSDAPVTGDWNGDGKTDVGVYRESNRTFYLDFDLDGVSDRVIEYGEGGDMAVTGDWNGDGVSDIGVYRPSKRTFHLDCNLDGASEIVFAYGASGDVPVSGDWDADGAFDVGLYRPSNRTFYIDFDEDGKSERRINYGASGDLPVAGDWDGDGRFESGVYRRSNGTFYLDFDLDGITDAKIQAH